MFVIWYILLIIFTIIGINIIIDYVRYGRKIFDCFKRRKDKVNMTDLLINILKNELRNKVLIVNRNSDYFIAVTKYDIFLIQLMNDAVSISGSINDSVFKVNNKHIKEIKNPLPQFIKDIKLLLNNGVCIKPIIVKTHKDCNLNLRDFDKRNIFTLQDFSYTLYKLQHSTFKYSDSDVDTITVQLKEMLDGNN